MAETYELQQGDTLGAIAQRYGMTLAQLLAINPQIDTKAKNWDRKLKIGLPIIIKPGPPPAESGGPIQGKGGLGYSMNYEPEPGSKPFAPEVVNPTSQYPRKASAVRKEDEWRPGKELEDKKQIAIPVEVYTPPPPPPPPPPPTPFNETTLGKIHSYIDPVAVFAGEAGNPNFKAGLNDYLGLALQGFGGGRGALPGPVSQPFQATPGPAAGKAMNAIGWYGKNHPTFGSRGTHPWPKDKPVAGAREPTFSGNPMPEKPPVGARERPIEAPEPLVVKASDMKSVQDVRNALRSASDNTVVLEGASDLGFAADRVLITKGRGGKKIDPEKVLDSLDTPVLTQGMFARVLRHLGFSGG